LIFGAGRLARGWRPERLSGPGYFLVLLPDHHEAPRPARAYWLTDDIVRVSAGRVGTGRPRLDLGSWHEPPEPDPPKRADTPIAGRIDRARVLNAWTRKHLASVAHVDPKTLADMCAGRRQPTFGTVQAVCTALGLAVADVIRFEEDTR
jgi:DNA-binding Xre family transcriptional regulator